MIFILKAETLLYTYLQLLGHSLLRKLRTCYSIIYTILNHTVTIFHALKFAVAVIVLHSHSPTIVTINDPIEISSFTKMTQIN